MGLGLGQVMNWNWAWKIGGLGWIWVRFWSGFGNTFLRANFQQFHRNGLSKRGVYTESSSVVGSLPFGQSMSQPLLASGPFSVLPFDLPIDGTSDMQYQHLIDLAETL